MKRLTILLAIMLNALWAMAQFSGSGSGTSTDPYLIYNPIQLLQVENALSEHFKLMTDIDVSDVIAESDPSSGWKPIGSSTTPFSGVFDGNGHKISGLYINRSTSEYVGFFSYVTGTVKNLQIEGSSIKGKNYVGALAGYIYESSSTGPGLIEDCTIKMSSSVSGTTYVGGVVGSNNTSTKSWSNITYNGNVEGSNYCGGIVGEKNYGSLRGCCVSGNVSGNTYVGGIGGSVGSAKNCKHYGNTSGQGRVGGICGILKDQVSNCYVEGNIRGGNYTGGICGAGDKSYKTTTASSTARMNIIESCYKGDITITGNSTSRVGGIVGMTSPQPSGQVNYDYVGLNVIKCVAIGNIYAGDSDEVGGIVGYCTRTSYIQDCLYNGDIIGRYNVAGIVGNCAESGTSAQVDRCMAICKLIQGVNCVAGISAVSGQESSSRFYPYVHNSVSVVESIVATEEADVCYIGKVTCFEDVYGRSSISNNKALPTTKLCCGNRMIYPITNENVHGIPTMKALLKLKATYVAMEWDLDNTWAIEETECYPYLKIQATPPYISTKMTNGITMVNGKCLDDCIVYYDCKGSDKFNSVEGRNQTWQFETSPLKAGDVVRAYTVTDGLFPSFMTMETVPFQGKGTMDEPFEIHTADDLAFIGQDGYYALMNDIDLSSWISTNSPTNGWLAVGNTCSIMFDGRGHTISGLWTNTSSSAGLFGSLVNGSEVKNLKVQIANGKAVKGGKYVGAVIARMEGSITNIQVSGNVEGTENVGGVVGWFQTGTINNCSFNGKMSSSTASACVGGIVGRLQSGGSIQKCKASTTSEVSGSSSSVGGVVGKNYGTVTMCYSDGSVTCTGTSSYTGGLVGNNGKPGTIDNCYSIAEMHGTLYLGGLVGYNYGSIDKTYALGDIYGVDYAGGVVGELDGTSASISNSVAMNNRIVLTAASSWAGRVLGGYKNSAAEPALNNYALNTMQVSLNDVPKKIYDDPVEGIAKTEAELKSTATYTALGWDMTDTWTIDEDSKYPELKWITAPESNPTSVAVTNITLSKSALELKISESATLTATVLPENATNKNVTWTSSNTEVATVENGVVTAVAEGNAVITVKAADGSNISAECAVTVTQEAKEEPTADYAMSITPVYSASGTSVNLSVCMTNKNDINGFQFDIVLPDGVTAQKSSRGKYVFNLGERGDDHTFSSTLKEDGSIRVICTSMSNAIFTGNSGEVCQIPVDLAEDLINGTYVVTLKNVSLSDTESTDIQASDIEGKITILNDYFEMGTASGSIGKTITLPVAMKNKSANICGFQCDIVMPEGFSIATNDKGKYLLSVTERGDDHSFSALDRGNNTVRVVCTSLTNASFTGAEGDLFEISLTTERTVEAGEYEIKLTNISLSNTASLDIPVADCVGTVTLKKYTPGDVNNDEKISVADVTAAISFVLGNESPSFIREAADMDANDEVKVNDVTAIISLVLNNDVASAKSMSRMMAKRMSSVANDSKLYIEPFSIAPGEEKYIDLVLDNPNLESIGWQADVELPAGLSFVTNDKGKFVSKINEARTDGYSISSDRVKGNDNAVRFIGVSMENFSIEGTSGVIMSILVKADENLAEGEYVGYLTNASLSDVQSNDVPVADSDFTATVATEKIDYAEGYSLVIKPFKAASGTAYTLTMDMNCATVDVTAMEFDIVAPEILARTKSGRSAKAPVFANDERIYVDDHSIDMTADGHVTIDAIVADEYRMIAGTSGPLVNFYYTANAGIEEGIYQIEINNIKMTLDDGTVLDVKPYKADVYVGTPTAELDNGCVAFHGDYSTAATYSMLTDAMPQEGVNAVDMTCVTALPANTTVATDGVLVYTSEDLRIKNTKNVVIDESCENLVLNDNFDFSVPKAFTAANASYDANVSASLGYKTLVLPYNCAVPAGFKAWEVASVVGNTLNMQEVSSITADKPVILEGNGTAAMNAANVSIAVSGAELENAELVGTYKEIDAPVGSYVLENHDGNVAFYKVVDVQPKVGAFRAYLKNQVSGSKKMIINFGTTTAIMDIESGIMEKAEAVYGIDGTVQNGIKRGYNVLRMKDGSVRKLFKK